MNTLLMIPMTFLVAIVLTLLPMPEWSVWFRPAWVMMVLIYWTMMAPHRVNVGTAWIVGLILDVLNGTLLGEHALVFTMVSYVVIRMHKQLRMYSILQQALWVCGLGFFYEVVIYCIQGFIGALPNTWLYWMSCFTSMLLWPWVFVVLRDYQRRFVLT
jgi:rod shape-determining protein MreD